MNLLDLFFPKRCVGCKKVGRYLCASCFSFIRYLEYQFCPVCLRPAIGGATHPWCKTPQGLDGMIAATEFKGVIRAAVHELKYRYVSDLTETVTEILLSQLPEMLPVFDCLIPVPLHPSRQRTRGFNQSFLLAQHLGRRLQLPVWEKGLIRIRNTTPQFNLRREERKANVLGAFSWEKGPDITGKTIALMDDVATTTATLAECAKVLKRQKAAVVWALVLAHR